MDTSELSWLSELRFDQNSILMDDCEVMDSFDDEVAALLASQDVDFINNHDINSSSPTLMNINSMESAPKLHEPSYNHIVSTFTTTTTTTSSNTPIILNFDNATEPNPTPELQDLVMRPSSQLEQPTKRPSRIRPPSQTYDHIVAERKRREQLSQRFLTLSTIVPGLKKMDKTSVLGDAIKYLKHLQERVKTLEEQARKQTMESVVLVKRSQVTEDDDDNDESSDGQPLPEIEARVCDKHIFIRVHCEKHRGVLVNLLSKVEKLNLAIINTNVTPFGTFAVDITIIAEMEKDFNLTMKEVVKRLRAAL